MQDAHISHPYFIASDLAALAALTVALTVLGQFPGIAGTQFALVFVGMFVYYRGALAMKARWLAMPSRSFLQDTLFILLPMYGLVVWTLHYPRALAFDVVGVLLPAYIAVVRIGCFLGGCCYGVPSRYGVLYPREIFTPVDGCRRFRPGPVPNGRVLPVQLVESAGAALLFVFLFAWLTRQPTPPGTALPLSCSAIAAAASFSISGGRRARARTSVGGPKRRSCAWCPPMTTQCWWFITVTGSRMVRRAE